MRGLVLLGAMFFLSACGSGGGDRPESRMDRITSPQSTPSIECSPRSRADSGIIPAIDIKRQSDDPDNPFFTDRPPIARANESDGILWVLAVITGFAFMKKG